MEWEADNSKTITFVVTKDCQLACKYCYLVGKNSKERMSWDIAKEAVDFVLSQYGQENFTSEAVIFDFIGGEPFLEIDLIDKVCDYIKKRLYELNHPWFNLYRFSFSTNGLNYHTEKVQRFIKKNYKHLSIGFSIDGTKAKHDLNRIWKVQESEKGSYDDVVSNVPLWLEQFPDAATKVTISSEDIPYICESVLHLFSLGIHHVNINCVFEDVWKDGDDFKFENQLLTLADEMVFKGLYHNYECSFFDKNIGKPLSLSKDNNNWCGCGHMIAIDTKGHLYPCIRFIDFALTNKKPRITGSIYTGINRNKLRPFLNLDRVSQSNLKCLSCGIASGCSWCQGQNYDSASIPSIFIRSTAICKMHEARVRANEYYWNLVDNIDFIDIVDLNELDPRCSLSAAISLPYMPLSAEAYFEGQNTYYCKSRINRLTISLSSEANSICGYDAYTDRHVLIDKRLLCNFFEKYGRYYDITVVYPQREVSSDLINILDKFLHRKIIHYPDYFELINEDGNIDSRGISLTFSDFYTQVADLNKYLTVNRLNIYLYDYADFDRNKYSYSLQILKNQVLYHWRKGHKIRVNLITDPLGLRKINECTYGTDSLFIAPNGSFYLCPAFYYEDDIKNAIGTIEKGWSIKHEHLFHREYSPVCRNCSRKACLRCVFENAKSTLEYNIPSYEQCQRSEVENDICLQFFKEL